MPERLYRLLVERAAESEGDEADSAGARPSPSLTSSGSFSSLLSLLSASARPALSSPASTSLPPASPSSSLSLSAQEKEQWERRLQLLLSAPSSPACLLPPSPMLVQKHKRGLFSSTWKKRYVWLTEDVVGISEERRGRATQVLLLAVGRVQAKVNANATPKKGHLFTVDVECFAESDTRVLTNRGLLFLGQIEQLQGQGVQVLFGCYDVQSKALRYSQGKLVFPQRPPPYLVEFTSDGEDARWAEGSDDYGTEEDPEDGSMSGHVSLRVTPEHRMYVQLGDEGVDGRLHWSGLKGARDPVTRQPLPVPHAHCKVRAVELLPIAGAPGACIRMLACAQAGYQPQANSQRRAVQRGLHLDDTQFAGFIELLGFWLGNGSIACSPVVHGSVVGEVSFDQLKQADLSWLRSMLRKAGLEEDEHWLSNSGGSVTTLCVKEPAWFAFFHKEFYGMRGLPGVQPEAVKSVKHLPGWTLQELSAAEMRLLIRGLQRAAGLFAGAKNALYTSSAHFRDQLMQALLHCGYSAYAGLMPCKDEIRGSAFHDQSQDSMVGNVASWDALDAAEQGSYWPTQARADCWKVSWAEVVDGHNSSGRAGSCWPAMSRQQSVKSLPYDAQRDGRTWCVEVEHADHLIFAQRAHRGPDGVTVTKQSRPVVVGNCWSKSGSVQWSRRSVLFALSTAEEVRVWVDAIQQLVAKRRRVSLSVLPWQSQSTRGHHAASSLSLAPAHQRAASSVLPPVNRPLFLNNQIAAAAAAAGSGSASSSPVLASYSPLASSFVPPVSSSSPPSASRQPALAAGQAHPAATLSVNDRRRNSVTRFASGLLSETVVEGREEPASAKASEPSPAGREKRLSPDGGRPGLQSPPSLHIEEHEEAISAPAVREWKDGEEAAEAEEQKQQLPSPAALAPAASPQPALPQQQPLTVEDDDAPLSHEEEDGKEPSLNGYRRQAGAGKAQQLPSAALSHCIEDVQSLFSEAAAQLAEEELSSSAKRPEAERRVREAGGLHPQRVVSQLQQRVVHRLQQLAPALEGSGESGEGEDAVCRSWRAVLPVIDLSSLSSSLFPPPISSLSTLGDIFAWEYDIFSLPASSLLPLVYSLFSHFSFFSLFSIPLPVFSRFISSIRQQYHDQPFHSFWHAVDVAQSCFVLLTAFHAQRLLSPAEQFALLISALCHDVAHPALNNAYQVNAGTALSLLCNDQSVLENHHCALLFHTLQHHALNVFASFHQSELRHTRRCITRGILNTDMALHFQLLDRLQQQLDGAAGRGDDRERALLLDAAHLSDTVRVHLFSVLLHAADISNPCKPWELHRRWTEGLLQELLQQGRQEEREGLQRSAYTDGAAGMGEMTVQFSRTFVLPLFSLLQQRVMPDMSRCLQHLSDNIARWQQLHDRERREAEAAALAPRAVSTGAAVNGWTPAGGKAKDDVAGGRGGAAAVSGQRGLLGGRQSAAATLNAPPARAAGSGGLHMYRRRNSAV